MGIQFAFLGILVVVTFVGGFADANGLILQPKIRYAVRYNPTV